jgi:dTMP kinase
LAPLLIIAFVSEALLLLSLPSRDATIPGLVPPGALPQANGLVMGASYGMLPVGAALFSGLRLASEHVPAWIPFGDAMRTHPLAIPFLFDAATFLFAAAMFAALPAVERRVEGSLNVFAGLTEAWRFVRRSRVIRGLAAGVGVAMLGGGVLFALGIGYIRQTLEGGDVEFGFLASLWGLGMALGLGVVRLSVRERGEPGAFRIAVAACGGILVTMAFLPILWLALVAALVFGMAFSVAVMLGITILQRATEDSMMGRLLGGAQMLFRVALAAGALGVGAAAGAVDRVSLGPLSLDGNQFGLLLGGALILVGAAASAGVTSGRVPQD